MVQAGVRLSVINTALRVNVVPLICINEGDDLPFFGRSLTDRERPHEVKNICLAAVFVVVLSDV